MARHDNIYNRTDDKTKLDKKLNRKFIALSIYLALLTILLILHIWGKV
jgi:hypothetical protein